MDISTLGQICALTVIHLEIGSCESRDSHSQKPVSSSDKRVSPIQHFTSFPVQNAALQTVIFLVAMASGKIFGD